MRRSELEHLIRAAASVTNQYEIMIVGSQSILGACPDAPGDLLLSMEADFYPLHGPERLGDVIDGAIGEGSPFHECFGYYAQGVGPNTATLPAGWDMRVVKIQNENTDLKIGYCLEPHDLAASKLAAGREKDGVFVRALLDYQLVEPATLQARINTLPIPQAHKSKLVAWLAANAPK